MIIDGGSCNNLASSNMVDKLALKYTNGESGAKSVTDIVSNKVFHQRTIVLQDHLWWELQQLS
jgi:hypothetical protein